MQRILILCKSALGTRMSSPGIRAYNMARVVAAALPDARVTLGVDGPCDLTSDGRFEIRGYTGDGVRALIRASDTVISQGFPPRALLSFPSRRVVLDFFTNFMIEGLEYRTGLVSDSLREAWLETQRRYLNLQLTLADFVICANERQRDAWLGMMSSLGLISGEVYDRDNTLRQLVAVCPYGVRDAPPAPRRRLLKDVYPGIGEHDRVILWNGGIVRYYDPVTLLRAFDALLPANPGLKLLFLGNRYPVEGFDIGDTLGEAIDLTRRLGLEGRHVFFNDGWLPYDESGEYMLEADVGVSTYFDNLETHYSFRTRLVDFIWARLPFVCTRGDVLAALAEEQGLGLTVNAGDVAGVAAALDRLLNDDALRARCCANLDTVAASMTWERQLAPLVLWLRGNRSIAQPHLWRAPAILRRTASYLAARSLEARQSSAGGRGHATPSIAASPSARSEL
jgi:glycosyltransferase involved in cell wall biosynthesis